VGSRKHVILKISKNTSDITGAAVLYSSNGYTDVRKQYEHVLCSVKDELS